MRACVRVCVQVKQLLDDGHPATVKDLAGATGLTLAAATPSFAHFQCIHRLLEAGAPLRARVAIPEPPPLEGADVDNDDDDDGSTSTASVHTALAVRGTSGGSGGRYGNTQTALDIAGVYKSPAHTILELHLRRVDAQEFLKQERREYRLLMCVA